MEAVRPKPLNLLVVRDIGLRVDDIAALGVRRISVGGALALAAWTGFTRAAETLKSEGSFAGFADLVSYATINNLFATSLRAHCSHAVRRHSRPCPRGDLVTNRRRARYSRRMRPSRTRRSARLPEDAMKTTTGLIASLVMAGSTLAAQDVTVTPLLSKDLEALREESSR